MAPPSRRAVLLDRDGTINVDVHYLSDPDQLRLLPGAAQGLRRLQAAGFALIVVTNQSGVARGVIDPEVLDRIHDRFHALLAEEGVTLTGLHACVHGPDDDCACRKPRPGLVEAAQALTPFDPAQSYMIGDKQADLDLGLGVGACSILVRTGHGRETEAEGAPGAAFVADSLDEAASFILAREAAR
ncbi:D-glycero-alpha-D-manno-heptose-1,7-bisphosphate 7-phosphatase [Pararhodospirillum oryzae]|uniref:D,D-heptose 1,7-bisphosphate phosphatase n=1 Tax=Pararhodospirillum oryzae TaxID=478448 RepID=A0A512H908_9PROT|nr:HAD family hydrolase [Pararhodospirillum oryzae]GEO81939.1 D,D-heptose 1,7-bisphosphate phosphatase [Pararhodospirillum oryzae]